MRGSPRRSGRLDARQLPHLAAAERRLVGTHQHHVGVDHHGRVPDREPGVVARVLRGLYAQRERHPALAAVFVDARGLRPRVAEPARVEPVQQQVVDDRALAVRGREVRGGQVAVQQQRDDELDRGRLARAVGAASSRCPSSASKTWLA